MPQRFLRPGITTSDAWNACSWAAQSLYVRILTVVDDYGRYDGRPAVIWGQCFSLRSDMNPTKTETLLRELSDRELIDIYEIDGKPYLQILRWQERTRGASKYPAPLDAEHLGEPVGTIYFIRAGDTDKVKIGYTQFEPEERLRRLQAGSSERLVLLATMDGTLREERALHRQFKVDNVGGEWFILSRELETFISERATRSKCAQMPDSVVELLPPSPLVSASDQKPSFKRQAVATAPFPPELETEAFREAWTDWESYRRERKKPITPTARKHQLSQLAQMGEARAVAALKHTIFKQWEGIREPDQPNGTHQRTNGASSGRNSGTANEGRASQYAGVGRIPSVPNDGRPAA